LKTALKCSSSDVNAISLLETGTNSINRHTGIGKVDNLVLVWLQIDSWRHLGGCRKEKDLYDQFGSVIVGLNYEEYKAEKKAVGQKPDYISIGAPWH
jgi:hypothetical protein